MNSAWKKLWPEAVSPRDFEGFEDGPSSPIVEHILSPCKSRGLEVNDEDVKAFVEKHKEEPSTEESRVAAGISLGEAEGRE